jgi:hypothetical protein
MDEIEHGTLSLQFRHHSGGAAGLGNFHLFLAQSLQIIPIHPDLESASHHKPSLVSNYIKSIEINFVNSLRGALDDFRSLEDFFWQQEARLAPATGNRVSHRTCLETFGLSFDTAAPRPTKESSPC